MEGEGSSKKPLHRVHFKSEVEVQRISWSASLDSDEEYTQQALFYSRHDIDTFRSSFQQEAAEDEVTYSEMVVRLHQACRAGSNDESDHAAEQDLQQLLHQKTHLVGLECTTRELQREKHIQLEEMMDRIHDIQDSVVRSSSNDDDCDAAEQIRAECERITLPSRKFATRLAQVSATAA
eukprot:CAMPEP_0172454690 /NCGR_PEP_ID=MMETSP1065-20121228/11610_1 /TAXON_ID=265537 /ORGANISM="Amphiprora paludosa, Strain CCMP125" /LENGTH=178 /DNA_ID=CAMNT_0013207069 /DNA_START=61 /DNA_END=597 /DNA_ORIENTATION=+